LEKEDSECSEVLVVKAVEAFFIPKVAAIIKGVGFETGSTQTEIGGADNSNAKPGFHIAKSHGIGALPFVANNYVHPLQKQQRKISADTVAVDIPECSQG